MRSSAFPRRTVMPAVEVKASRGTSVRSSTNWRAGTETARSVALGCTILLSDWIASVDDPATLTVESLVSFIADRLSPGQAA
jgi:hypothetical protein